MEEKKDEKPKVEAKKESPKVEEKKRTEKVRKARIVDVFSTDEQSFLASN